jgi:glucose/arabinose dehydrogenase
LVRRSSSPAATTILSTRQSQIGPNPTLPEPHQYLFPPMHLSSVTAWTFSNGHPSGKAQDIVTGFLDAEGHARGRPVGLTFDKSGALLIADDVGNTVWRVSSN